MILFYEDVTQPEECVRIEIGEGTTAQMVATLTEEAFNQDEGNTEEKAQ